jgi:hypothetical protein
MANIWSLFEDYEKRYHGWLKESAIPKTTEWTNQALTGLLGQEQRTMHPTEGVISTRPGIGSLDTAGGVIKDYFTRPNVRTMHPTEGVQVGKQLQSQFQRDAADAGVKSLEITRDVINWGVDKANSVYDQMFPNANKNISTDAKKRLIKENMKTDPFGSGKRGDQPGFTDQDASSLAKFAGVNLKDAAKEFKNKGGFEGLMSNPAFTLGLALMQSSAQGKDISQGVMDNFIKAAGISDHYKDRIQARKDRLEAKGEVVGPPSEEEMGVVERVLESKKFKTYTGWSVGSLIDKNLYGKDREAQYHSTVSAIAAKVKQKSEAAAKKGKKVQITEDYVSSIVNEMIANKELEKGKGATTGFWSSPLGQIIGDPFGKGRPELKKKEYRAEGGPVQAGQPYVVGEKGPEVVIPKADANVVSNDDAQVMGMLLASNPQLQNVSKARAESILRSRFPDYFA